MATLDVTDVIAVEFIVETVVTAPDSNTFIAKADSQYGVPVGQNSMTVSIAGKVNCMLRSGKRTADNIMPQFFTVDEVRTSA